MKFKTKNAFKTVIVIFSVILAVLLAVDIFIGNYLVSFALTRPDEKGRSVAPESSTTSEADKITDANIRMLSEKTKAWLETVSPETAEIQSDDGLHLKGDIISTPEENHLWAIVIHGYTAKRIYMYDYACAYAEQGWNVLLPDMRTHGESEGNYIGMGWLDRLDVLKWIDLIRERDEQAQIILHGVSMGGATVMMTSGENLPENVRAIIDDCGYTSVWDIFSDELNYLFHLPEFPFLYTADVISKIRAGYSFQEAYALNQVEHAEVPMMFIHGSADSFV